MAVRLLIITHSDVGSALINAVNTTLGELPLETTVVPVNYDSKPEYLLQRLKNLIETQDSTEGILILTDLYGSTPCNIAVNLCKNKKIRVISGLNLPMLIRVMNYPKLDLNTLATKALSGGRDGVICYNGEAA